MERTDDSARRPTQATGTGQADTSRWVKLSTGVALPFVEQGDHSGPAVLLLHPWAESRGCFDRLRPLLPAHLHVLAPDQRGHGQAEQPATGYSLASFAADAVAFLDALGVDRAVLVGSSSGGYVAQQVAVDHPDRVSGLVLVGSPRSLHGRPPFADEVEALVDPVDPAWVRASLDWFPRFHEVPDWYVEDRVRDGAGMPARTWRDTLAGLTSAIPPTRVGSIRAPTLIVWGELDGLLAASDAQGLLADIARSRLVVYEGTGHLVLWEVPERLARDLAGFVGSLPA
ncbi:MAG: alpha/beta hydrolase [Candidatus Nanopelagicales bacterium]